MGFTKVLIDMSAGEAGKQAMMAVLHSQPAIEEIPTLSLPAYRDLIGEGRPPTDEEIRSFATAVSTAKSWYKHLPLVPPGKEFRFFIDPQAGLDRVMEHHGKASFVQRSKEASLRYHPMRISTEDYRAIFGRLSFVCEAGSRIVIALAEGDPPTVSRFLDNNPSRSVVYGEDGAPRRVPGEVLEAGRCDLTGAMHPLAASAWVWLKFLPEGPVMWPRESGGAETLRKVIDRCVSIEERSPKKIDDVDSTLEALLSLERERLQTVMIRAMERMRGVLYGPV